MRLEAEGYRLEAGGWSWRLEATGWRLKAGACARLDWVLEKLYELSRR